MGIEFSLPVRMRPIRFLFARRLAVLTGVLSIIYRAIETCQVHRAGQTRNTARTGAITLIQRFGRSDVPGALNLNIHLHMLFLDGVYLATESPAHVSPRAAPGSRGPAEPGRHE